MANMSFTLAELIRLVSANRRRRVKDPQYESVAASRQLDLRFSGRTVAYEVLQNPLELFADPAAELPAFALVLAPVEAYSMEFHREIRCRFWIFAGECNFTDSRWKAGADFSQSFFLAGGNWSRSKFVGDGIFELAQFYGDTLFNEAEFNAECRFNSARFHKSVSFSLGYLAKSAYFKDVSFSSDCDFSNAHVDGPALFSASSFGGSADFTAAEFSDSLNFNGVNALGHVNFSQAQFLRDVSFSWYKFADEVLFSGARFASLVIFNDGYFAGKCSFGDVNFEDAVTISGSDFKEHLDMSGALFHENAYLVNNSFRRNVYFGGVTFDGGGRVFIDASMFEADSFFTGSYINKEVLFMKSNFGRRTDFTQLIIGEAGKLNLIECVFNSIVDFSEIEELTGTIFIDKSDFIRKCLLQFSVIKGSDGSFSPLIIRDGDKVDNDLTMRNFASFREMYNKNNELDNELELLYKSRVYERRKNFSWRKGESVISNSGRALLGGLSWLFLDRTSRYFTDWMRVIRTILVTIIAFAGLYALAPVVNSSSLNLGNISGITSNITSAGDLLAYLGENLYFSLITFTTIGYGDLLPTGVLRIFAGFQGFLGITLTSVFLVSLAKRVLG